MTGFAIINQQFLELSLYYYTIIENSVQQSAEHPTLVGSVIRLGAPKSHLYCKANLHASQQDYLSPFPSSLSQSKIVDGQEIGLPYIRIQNYSWNTYKANSITHGLTYDTTYTDVDRSFDNYVYTYGQNIFISSANGGTDNPEDYVLSPAKAMNVISVGNYVEGFTKIINQNGSYTSSYVDPSTKAQKPEISAPGTDIRVHYDIPMNPPRFGDYISTGTSFASPHAAAFAADAMSKNSFLQNNASMLKAYMLASATDYVSGGHDRVGEGGIKFQPTNNTNLAYWMNPNNDVPFTDIGDGWYCMYNWTTGLTKGRHTRIAVAWQNRGDFVLNNNQTGIDLNIYIHGPDYQWYNFNNTMNSATNPYELFEFTPPVSGTYRAYICKMKESDTASKIDMGWAVIQE